MKKAIQAIALALLAVAPLQLRTQSPSDPKFAKVVYEVVSIKPNNSDADGSLEALPNGLNYKHVTLARLVRRAYGVEAFQISGAPDWAMAQAFDLEARTDDTVTAALKNLSPDERELVREKMLQIVLAERFHLAVHHEMRQVPVYFLKAINKGSKLQAAMSANTDEAVTVTSGSSAQRGTMRGQSATMATLVSLLSSMSLGRPVIDKTELSGRYDFTFSWSLGTDTPVSSAGGESTTVSDPNAPSIFTALKEQVGLELASGKAEVDFIVIDHVERPDKN